MRDKKKMQLLGKDGALTHLGNLLVFILWGVILTFGMYKIEDFQTQKVYVGQEIRISTNSSIMNHLEFPAQISTLDKTEDSIRFVVREAGSYRIGIGDETRYYIRAKEGIADSSCITLQNYSFFWVKMGEFVFIGICFVCALATNIFFDWLMDKLHKKQE